MDWSPLDHAAELRNLGKIEERRRLDDPTTRPTTTPTTSPTNSPTASPTMTPTMEPGGGENDDIKKVLLILFVVLLVITCIFMKFFFPVYCKCRDLSTVENKPGNWESTQEPLQETEMATTDDAEIRGRTELL